MKKKKTPSGRWGYLGWHELRQPRADEYERGALGIPGPKVARDRGMYDRCGSPQPIVP